MNKKLILVLLVLVVLAGGFYFFKSKSYNKSYDMSENKISDSNMDNNSTSSSTIVEASSTIYTIADISMHAPKDSCWSSIEGKVYDLTSWIGKHPGGDKAILSICGKDGSQTFDGKHGMDPKAKGVLPKFYLGDLAN